MVALVVSGRSPERDEYAADATMLRSNRRHQIGPAEVPTSLGHVALCEPLTTTHSHNSTRCRQLPHFGWLPTYRVLYCFLQTSQDCEICFGKRRCRPCSLDLGSRGT